MKWSFSWSSKSLVLFREQIKTKRNRISLRMPLIDDYSNAHIDGSTVEDYLYPRVPSMLSNSLRTQMRVLH